MALRLPTVLLEHVTRAGRHFDWLLADPSDPPGPLWTARVAHRSAGWALLGAFSLTPLPPHRRRYLTVQGDIGQGRGRVQRVDEGWFEPRLWTVSRRVLSLSLRGFRGEIELRRRSQKCWIAQVRSVAPGQAWGIGAEAGAMREGREHV